MSAAHPVLSPSLHDALPISSVVPASRLSANSRSMIRSPAALSRLPVGSSANSTAGNLDSRSEEHTSELQSRGQLVCRLLLQKKKQRANEHPPGHEGGRECVA